MKLKFISIQFISLLLVLSINSINKPALATTQPNNTVNGNQVNGNNIFVENTENQINDFLGDVKNFVQDDLFSPITNLINSTIGAFQIPDISKLWNQILEVQPVKTLEPYYRKSWKIKPMVKVLMVFEQILVRILLEML